MKYELGDIFKLRENTFMVAEMATYMGIDYLLLNKLDIKEEPTEELYVYKIENNELISIQEEEILDIILPVFNNKLQKNITNIKNERYNI